MAKRVVEIEGGWRGMTVAGDFVEPDEQEIEAALEKDGMPAIVTPHVCPGADEPELTDAEIQGLALYIGDDPRRLRDFDATGILNRAECRALIAKEGG